ncbi:DUF397 domain-containing protein [Sphaerisporangium sp. B11E5]|uniref:DUF397 domain-containing protein n=1 Tax=Sphaerisporangium sp. B11E5 TaxID=3153563 RepID=UPI00325F8CC9
MDVGLVWRKSPHSGSGDQCVEVAALPDGGHAVRDSKQVNGPILRFAAGEWRAFVRDLKAGACDEV